MPNVKTAISLQASLFHEADALAHEMKVSRSHLFAVALEEYLRRKSDRQLLEKINNACVEAPDPGERKRLRGMRHHHRKIVEGGW